MKITIDMPWEKDLTVNHMRYGARGGYRKKPHVQKWMECVWKAIYLNRILDDPDLPRPNVPVVITIDFRFPDKRRRDTHNYFKVIADAVALGLGIDDKDIRISAGAVVVDRENAGFTIEISDSP